MENKLLDKLSKTFLIIAYLDLLAIVLLLGIKIYDVSMGSAMDSSAFKFLLKYDYSFLAECGYVFAYTANAFFAFLLADVFKMLLQKKLLELGRTRRLQKICCLAFVLEAFFILLKLTTEFPNYLSGKCQRLECGIGLGLGVYFSYGLKMLSHISHPLLMGIAIYILFNHFDKLLTFESEVA